MNKTCNQCGYCREMNSTTIPTTYTDFSKIDHYYCENPSCPNFALLQIPVEDLPKEIKKK